jgi:hypothetical protein
MDTRYKESHKLIGLKKGALTSRERISDNNIRTVKYNIKY